MSGVIDPAALAEELALIALAKGQNPQGNHWQRVHDYLVSDPPTPADADVVHAASQLSTDGWVLREHAIAELAADLRWLFEAGVVTLAELAALVTHGGIVTLADLESVADPAALEGRTIDSARAGAILDAVSFLSRARPHIPLGRALAAADPILERARATIGTVWALPTGSLRRGAELPHDIDLLVNTGNPTALLDAVASADAVEHVSYRSSDRIAISVARQQVTCRCASPDTAGAALLWTTGSRAHVAQLSAVAASRGLTLSMRGLEAGGGRQRRATTEAEVYEALGLPWIPPELRAGTDEIDRARRGTLPDLVQQDDLLGDFHMHTAWSDGRDSVEAMAASAVSLGYRYIAITDHSPSSAAVRSLQIADISKQADEIARAQERFPQLTILHGCEVDILPDGELDLPEKVLRRFDLVLASLHDRAGQSAPQLLRRYLGAMAHPLVTIITHPTNRQFPRRAGYDLDYDRLFEAAAETRTILEIDGAPSHLDLDAGLAARAIALGVTLSVDSDSHATEQMKRYMEMALLTARRAGVERKHVLNCRPLPEVRAVIASKRSRFPL